MVAANPFIKLEFGGFHKQYGICFLGFKEGERKDTQTSVFRSNCFSDTN